MIIQKLCALLLVAGLAFQTTVIAAPSATPDVKPGGLTPELKQNALELLSATAREAGQFNVPENRIRIKTIVFGLLWEHDEPAAKEISQNVFAELQNLLAENNPPENLEMTTTERSKRFQLRHNLAELRSEYLLTLAARDPQAASAALDALKVKLLEEEYDPLRTNDLELQLASAIAKKDPDKAYALAKEQLAAEGISHSFVESLKDLHGKNSRLAAELGKDVLTKIKNAKIRVPATAGNPPNAEGNAGANRPVQPEIEFWSVVNFINTASEMNRRASRDKEKKILPLLGEAEMREALDLIVRAFLSAHDPVPHSLASVMPEIIRYAPAQVQRIRLKIGASAAFDFDTVAEAASYQYIERKEKSAEELAKDAERAAPNIRNQRLVDAANKALEEDNPEKALEIASRIENRKEYAFLFEQINAALPIAKARRGDPAEVRKMLGALKNNQERIATLTELASALSAKGDKETAKNLLDESLQMLPAQIKKQPDLESSVKIAAALSTVAPEQAFTIVENGIAQMNEYINAGIRLGEFYEFGSIEQGELLYDSINRQVLHHAPNSIGLLKNLAQADFERTAGLADKFERPEIRLLVRLRIAQSLLDAEAAEKEKKMRERVQHEDEYH